MPEARKNQDDLYEEAAGTYGAALNRLARSYELDPDKQRDLLQDVHLAVWRSLAAFEHTCSLRTWVYRVAHNVAASHVLRQRRLASWRLVSLEDVENRLVTGEGESTVERSHALARVYGLIHRLKPLDRQIILLYLEGCDAASIAEVTGISGSNAATRVHRIKRILGERYHGGEIDGER
jgi:RNA polymerase sigma-70 factor, ECF subfamily